jgi:uncharacterized protein YjbJ (UPF0337 family)
VGELKSGVLRFSGNVEEGVGYVTGDVKTQILGKLDQAAGTAQDLYGQTAEAMRDACRHLRPVAPHDHRDTALCGGDDGARHRLLLGRMHRPV